MKIYFSVLLMMLCVSTVSAQKLPTGSAEDPSLVFHVQTESGSPVTGSDKGTIGHVDITFCAQKPRIVSKDCKQANSTFTVQLPAAISGKLQDAWLNAISVPNGVRGENHADVDSPRSITVTYTPSISDQEETFRIYFKLIP